MRRLSSGCLRVAPRMATDSRGPKARRDHAASHCRTKAVSLTGRAWPWPGGFQGLLTASVARRLTLQQTVEHPWVANRLRARQMLNIPYRLSSQERALILTKVALTIKSTVQSVEAQTRQDALGEVTDRDNATTGKEMPSALN